MAHGYNTGSTETEAVVERWRDAPPDACLISRSVDFLKRTERENDLKFILSHIDDLPSVFAVRNGEVEMLPQEAPSHEPFDVCRNSSLRTPWRSRYRAQSRASRRARVLR
jgi:hypothetical protein